MYRLTDLGDARTRFDYRLEFHPPLGPLGAVAGRAVVGHLPQREAEASLLQVEVTPRRKLTVTVSSPNKCERMTMADFLDEKRREIASRLKELEPLVQEHDRLRAALDALDGVGGRGGRGARLVVAPALGPWRAAAAARAPAAAAGARAARARARRRPSSSSAPAPASRSPRWPSPWGSSRTTSTACSPASQKDGLVRKEGRGWHAAGRRRSAPPTA